jgi:cellulose synthase/poly-beta-1,6-N-acetylglucosamine synthase-like glycosyltransferase
MLINTIITILISILLEYLLENFIFNYIKYVIPLFIIYLIYLKLKKNRIYFNNSINLENKFITLLIPAKNEEKSILNSLKYVLQSNYPKDKYHVIIINDNSTDSTLQVLNKMNLPSNVTILNRRRTTGFVAGVLNDGLDILPDETEIVGVVDSDCMISINLLQEISYNYNSNFKGAIQIQEWHYNCMENFITMAQHLLCIYENYCIQDNPDFKVGHFYHKSLIKLFKKYNEESIIEDYELSHFFKKNNVKIKTLYQTLIYRQFSNNLKTIYSQQYRYALGKQLINYKEKIVQNELFIPLVIMISIIKSIYYKNFNLLYIITFISVIIYLLLFEAWSKFYKISFKSSIKNSPDEVKDIILKQGYYHSIEIINIFTTIFLTYFILLIRLLPFIKIPLSIEKIKWNRFN